MSIHAAVESFARESYGQALAILASRAGGDIAAAEDALGEGLLNALRQWPQQGVPEEPVAWLMAAAKRRLIDAQRRDATRHKHADRIRVMLEASDTMASPDQNEERLNLLFVCAHPAIEEATRAPLMLQVVLGVEADRIASAYLVSPAAMSQRLVRAKARIKGTGIPFAIPPREHWAERLEAVLAAIYAAYTLGEENSGDGKRGLSAEAVGLARLLVKLLPEEPEALGLLALCLHREARAGAQWLDGQYIPLPEQDVERWNHEWQHEAEANLRAAARHQRPGRYQIEAAIQSVHASRRFTGITYWPAIADLYQSLLSYTPAIGARIGHAIARCHVHGPETGLGLLDAMPENRVLTHQPWWAARAEMLSRLGRAEEAHAAYQKAIGLSEHPSIRAFLQRRCCEGVAPRSLPGG